MKEAIILAAAIGGGVAFIVWAFASAMRSIVSDRERRGGDIAGFCPRRLCEMDETEREALDATFAQWKPPPPARAFPALMLEHQPGGEP